jgi:hypothetical protein
MKHSSATPSRNTLNVPFDSNNIFEVARLSNSWMQHPVNFINMVQNSIPGYQCAQELEIYLMEKTLALVGRFWVSRHICDSVIQHL